MVHYDQPHSDWWSFSIKPQGRVVVRAGSTGIEGDERVFSEASDSGRWTEPVAWIADEIIEGLSLSSGPKKRMWLPKEDDRTLSTTSGDTALWEILMHTGVLLRVRADVARCGSNWWRFGKMRRDSNGKIHQIAAVQRLCVRSARIASSSITPPFEDSRRDEAALYLLRNAMDRRDRLALDHALEVTVSHGVSLEHLWMLSTAYSSSWHDRHETVAAALGRLPSEEVASVLLGFIRSHGSVSAFSDRARWMLQSSVATIAAIPGVATTLALERLSDFGPELVRDASSDALQIRSH